MIAFLWQIEIKTFLHLLHLSSILIEWFSPSIMDVEEEANFTLSAHEEANEKYWLKLTLAGLTRSVVRQLIETYESCWVESNRQIFDIAFDFKTWLLLFSRVATRLIRKQKHEPTTHRWIISMLRFAVHTELVLGDRGKKINYTLFNTSYR